jgi:hypothetical protein
MKSKSNRRLIVTVGSIRHMGLGMLLCIVLAGSLLACSVPVFRYALERWPVDAYRLAVFHRGDLSTEQQALRARLEQYGELGYGRPPLVLQWVDVTEPIPEPLTPVWEKVRQSPAPLMVLLPPAMGGGEEVVLWTAPLTTGSVDQLADSPVRRDLAQRLIEGETAVWLLLRSGDRDKDDALAATLAEGLGEMEASLKLPHQLDPGDTEYDTALSEDIELKIAFSVLPMDLDDPCETLLASVFKDIVTASETPALPAVVPVFGRARALVFLDEADIELDTIAEICHFLVGPCSCQVKQLNPGVDLPLLVDWDARIIGMMGDEEIPMSLLVPGVMAAAEEDTPPVEAVDSRPVDANAAADPVVEAAVPAETNRPSLSPRPTRPLRRRLVLLALATLAFVLIGSALLMKRTKAP